LGSIKTMLIEPFTFKEFESATVAAKELRKSPFTPKRANNDEPPPPPPTPTFSEDELKSAERDAYQRGFLDGIKDGMAQAQNEQADAERVLMERLENFAENISPIFERYKAHCLQLKQNMPPLALAIARKVAGEAITNDHQEILQKAVQHCMETMISEPNVIITINEKLAHHLSNKLQKLNGKVPSTAHIEVIASEQMPFGDYYIEWKNGSLERSTEKLWQQMEKAINNMLSMLANEQEEQLDLFSGLTTR
jgi:flagellar assembly protein FliH